MVGSIRLFVLVTLATLAAVTAEDGSVPCTLSCENGGYCSFVESTSEELAHLAQSGHLIEKCVCPAGYGGVGCEYEVGECNTSDLTCPNGRACEMDASGEWGCQCSVANEVSSFAGHQCSSPATEYCSGQYVEGVEVSFCTNGGRCLGDFIAAEVAPGDTNFNKVYQYRGCKCPTNFYGPHCEFLNIEGDEDLTSASIASLTHRSPLAVVLLCFVVISVGVVAVVVHRRLARQRVPGEISIDNGGSSWPTATRPAYRDSMYNGKHYHSRDVNLRMEFALDDVDLT
eukprot:Nitzschia sp. Nitz4//scaffold40_size135432//93038//93971//NITZ4_003256-RA/size135432-snap-gene-0.132-mRNA-1//-1//CDS//3329551255//171//frame0